MVAIVPFAFSDCSPALKRATEFSSQTTYLTDYISHRLHVDRTHTIGAQLMRGAVEGDELRQSMIGKMIGGIEG